MSNASFKKCFFCVGFHLSAPGLAFFIYASFILFASIPILTPLLVMALIVDSTSLRNNLDLEFTEFVFHYQLRASHLSIKFG
jgi:hypothetical protein|uniref:Uncharacterized protein n=1 Tax=Picea glauca TaxID=3330 RepID=A0A124GMN5_PICGL|nr:hypothetical protein ABT39_MTgene1728 [Picea glauca]KUM48738.1 hypothetical protein ABT39_MTgene4753 [Picea glauca]QHR89618.1 hypothetical protein Q903MT_gene3640 [Picea sitchensis]